MTCGECYHFIHPAPQYERNSVGACKVMNAWLEKFKPKKPKPKDYDKNYALLGGKLYITDVDRNCARYRAKMV